MHWKEYIKEYFTYTSKEKRGINILLILLVVLLSVYFFINRSVNSQSLLELEENLKIDSLIGCIENKKETTLKFDTTANKKNKYFKTNSIRKKEYFTIDINAADTTEWMKIKGIGPVLSKRIVKYRYLLGGFTGIAQLGEVYGVDNELLENITKYLRLNANFITRKIDVNYVEEWELARHPYISEELAKQIIRYRKSNPFDSTEDFALRLDLDNATMNKLEPYILIKN